jgi:hypothetical protein
MISTLGRLLSDGHSNHPQALLARATHAGRSVGPLARALEGLFVEGGLTLPTDRAEQRATERRRRRIDPVPDSLRPAVEGFEAMMINNRERARRSGTRPRTDHTIETALAIVRDLACFLHQRGKRDWALVDVHDIEAFLAVRPRTRGRRLIVLRQFFRQARRNRLILIDPAAAVKTSKRASGFTGRTLQ